LNEELDTEVGAEASRLFGKCELSADLLLLLGMGRDTSDGVMKLRGEKLDLDWHLGNSKPYFDAVRERMRQIAGSLGADRFVHFPALYFVTVHPLGGCPMGRDQEEGVVDSYGKDFE
jgi:cholesterol oxidase